MRKAFRHTGVLMMLGVVALGLIGAAYTLWYEDLKLNVDVSTGTLNADWSLHDTDPNTPNVQTATEVIAAYNGLGPVPAAYADFLTTHPAAKYTQTCGANIGDWEAGPPDVPHANDDDDNNLLNLSMTGLYPYAGCKFSINIHSTGSVPIHLALESVMDNTGGADINVLLGPGSDPRCQALLDAILTADLGLISSGGNPIQLHQEQEIVCDVIFYLEQTSEENASGNFMAVIKAHQWNETPLP